ncbi:hypothetical protein [Pinibacter soli]|uniref:hypothetical protein n=1 Tax=Pinibacter soli TaxID=3044211 RepID=UPI00249B997B|nr:hypothetical protein [Pinibacter soli]
MVIDANTEVANAQQNMQVTKSNYDFSQKIYGYHNLVVRLVRRIYSSPDYSKSFQQATVVFKEIKVHIKR